MEVPPWQSVRLLTDRSSVRSREGAFFCWCTIIQMDDEHHKMGDVQKKKKTPPPGIEPRPCRLTAERSPN